MMNEQIEKYWDILGDMEDMLRGGFRTDHRPLPVKPQSPGARTDTEISPTASPPISTASPGAATSASKPADRGPTLTDRPGSGEPREELLSSLDEEVRMCNRCELGSRRINAVPGAGSHHPAVFVIGEGPGAEEDKTGLPFVGPAGRYLDKWLAAIGLSRETNTFIGNIVKCRPPQNRDPRPEEASACLPYLMRQIEILKPRAILTLGRIAVQVLMNTSRGIGASRGSVYIFHDVPLVATYHPSGVLRNPGYRPDVWDDLKLLKNVLDEA
jgi:DNA polymerase